VPIRRIFLLGIVTFALIVGSVLLYLLNKKSDQDASLPDANILISRCASIKDPIERTILEEIYTLGPQAVENYDPKEPNGYPAVFRHLAKNPHLNYVIDRAFPVRIDETKNRPVDWEEILENPKHWIEQGYLAYPYTHKLPPQLLRVVRGEWSVMLDQRMIKEVRILEDRRLKGACSGTIPFNSRRITNSDPLLESYAFEIMVPMDCKIPEQAIVHVDDN
jgi:hypothetical protein